ncbi:MAG: hypothetical protein ACJAXT_001283 [Paracoccaceae bacterium]|jgi:hypothetical protein
MAGPTYACLATLAIRQTHCRHKAMQSLLHRAYHPLLFDRHEIIHANDLWVESLYYSALRQPCDQAKFVPQPPKILHSKTAALCLPAWAGQILRGKSNRPANQQAV